MTSIKALALTFVVSASACMPPSVKAVDDWLLAYQQLDAEAVALNTCAADRELARSGVEAVRTSATSSLALMMPPRPIKHEIHEIETKEDGRHIIVATLTLKNPLPFMSEKVGHVLPGIPKTRSLKQRYLVIQEGERWGLKFDLALRQERLQFASRFGRLISKRRYAEAAALLQHVPPRPDSGNSLRKSDRLKLGLQAQLDKALKKVKNSTTSKAVAP